MKLRVLIFVLLIGANIFGQKQGNVWYFGDKAGLDFNFDPPAPLIDGLTYFPPPNGWNEGTSAICDSSGALLFYSNGEVIWNRNHDIMPNGNDILGHASSTMSSIIVPLPNSSRYFYLFTTDAYENSFENGFRYCVIDMCSDNQRGDIRNTQKNILIHENTVEKICAVQHTNGLDYWIVTHELGTNAFVSVRLTEDGLSDIVISNIGSFEAYAGWGQMAISPNGEKLAYCLSNTDASKKSILFDFDPNTGVVSNENILSESENEYGVSFSSDNSKLYFSTMGYGTLFQYDLSAGDLDDIIDSKYYFIDGGPDSWRQLMLGPDGKIYVSRTGKSYLSLIELPNLTGADANYIDSAIYLNEKTTSFGLPSFISGYQYQNLSSDCFTNLSEESDPILYRFYPNPFKESAILEFENIQKQSYALIIINSLGEKVQQIDNIKSDEILIEREKLTNGLYFFQLNSNSEDPIVGRFIIE